MRTSQEVFDIVVEHLFTQKGRAATEFEGDIACTYVSPDGRRCAVGALLPDDVELSKTDNTSGVGSLLGARKDLREFMCEDFDLLLSLQNAHDRPGHWDSFSGSFNDVGAANLLMVADVYTLNIDKIEKFCGDEGADNE